MAEKIIPDFKKLKEYCINLLAKYSNYQDQIDLVVTPNLTKCMFPIENLPNMFGRDYDDDLKGDMAKGLWDFVFNLRDAPETQKTKNLSEYTIKVRTLLNILSNLDNSGLGGGIIIP